MELILVVVISAGMVENSQNGVSRSLICNILIKSTWVSEAWSHATCVKK